MVKLNLPIIKGRIPEPKWLSMDDYLEFVYFNLKYTYNYNRRVNRQLKKMIMVNVPFHLNTGKNEY